MIDDNVQQAARAAPAEPPEEAVQNLMVGLVYAHDTT